MNIEHPIIKAVSAAIGAAIAYLFPTPVLVTLLYCLIAMGIIDAVTGIQAAVYRGKRVDPAVFVNLAGRKLVRGTAYLGIAWVAAQLVTTAVPLGKPVAEPVGAVLGLLIAADVLSILKNLAKANNNIPILDKYLGALFENLRQTEDKQ
jgi:phage-related holin